MTNLDHLMWKPDVFANEDFQFHPWVTSANLGQEKIIDFMPPDGNFELLRYRITENVHIPFQIAPVIRAISQNRIDILITVKSVFKPSRLSQKIKLQIPIPPHTKNVLLSCSKGMAKHKADNNTITWKIKRMGGMKETQLRAKIELSDDNYSDMAWAELPVLMMNFELPFALSGIKMIKLNVCEPNLKISNGDVIKWVRYMSIAGVYEIKYKTVS
uniref:MHD domain-containing protein n=1 Tax=Acrobeloides nanus TaxID=290746 RepID=A0A914CYC8_9BILA